MYTAGWCCARWSFRVRPVVRQDRRLDHAAHTFHDTITSGSVSCSTTGHARQPAKPPASLDIVLSGRRNVRLVWSGRLRFRRHRGRWDGRRWQRQLRNDVLWTSSAPPMHHHRTRQCGWRPHNDVLHRCLRVGRPRRSDERPCNWIVRLSSPGDRLTRSQRRSGLLPKTVGFSQEADRAPADLSGDLSRRPLRSAAPSRGRFVQRFAGGGSGRRRYSVSCGRRPRFSGEPVVDAVADLYHIVQRQWHRDHPRIPCLPLPEFEWTDAFGWNHLQTLAARSKRGLGARRRLGKPLCCGVSAPKENSTRHSSGRSRHWQSGRSVGSNNSSFAPILGLPQPMP
ncbi:MAG: hypothetical protein QOI11_5 [Candidatus Eremiobacteraeota bacterium]|nr:hypothetical protein [Candidatus Eremiobacteraeota bacterium]